MDRLSNKQRFTLGCVCLLMMIGGQATAEEPEPTVTEQFFGTEVDGQHAAVVLRQISPLFGGREYYLSEAGRLVIVDIRRDEQGLINERRFEIEKLEEDAAAVFKLMIAKEILAVPLELEDKPGPTCTNPPLMLLRNAAGDVRALPTIKGAPSKAYEDVLMAIAALMQKTRGIEPSYLGNLDEGYVPTGFEWTTPILANGKTTRWAPHATAADVAKAEREYQQKVRLQLQIIEEAKRKAIQSADKSKSASDADGAESTEPDGNNESPEE